MPKFVDIAKNEDKLTEFEFSLISNLAVNIDEGLYLLFLAS